MCEAKHFFAGQGLGKNLLGRVGWGESENPRSGAKKRVNFVIGRFIMPSGVFRKENIASSIFKRVTSCT